MTGPRTWRDDRDDGFALARARRRREAVPLLLRALTGCRAEQDGARSEPVRVDVLITEASILGILLPCMAHDGTGLVRLVTFLTRAVEVQESLSRTGHLTGTVTHGAHLAMVRLSDVIEVRRAALDSDVARIEVLETSASALDDLIGHLLGLGVVETALVAAERGRARALADRLGGGSGDASAAARPALTAGEIRDTVRRHGTVVAEFWVTDAGRGHVWVVHPDGRIAGTALPAGAGSVAGELAALRGEGPAALGALAVLGERLIGPLLADPATAGLLPGRDEPLAVVPHRLLHGVPFAGLPGPGGEPVLASWPLVTLPSIGVLAARDDPDRPRTAAPRSLLALVDPDLPPAALPVPRLPDLRAYLPPLSALVERTTERTGPDATFAALVTGAPGHDVVLLGTHARADRTDPDASSLVLAPDPPRHSGMVRIDEIAGQRIDAMAVVLLACATADGRITADGVLSVARGFLLSGARSVVAALWPVTDLAAEIVYAMLREWTGGAGRAEALRRAQLALRKRYPDQPRVWACTVLSGDGD